MSHAHLAVLTACDYEAAIVRRCIQPQRRHATPVGPLWKGKLNDHRVAVLRCGTGPAKARQAAIWLAHDHSLQCLINAGFVGALQPRLHTGDAVLAHQIQACSMPSTDVATTCTEPIAPTPALLHLADKATAPATYALHRGALLSVEDVIAQAALKQHLGRLSGALAVDMEAHSIAQVARQQQLPFVSLKTVFDPCADNVPLSLLQCVTSDGAMRPTHLMCALLRHPALLVHAPRFARKAKTAGRHLGNWLHQFLTLLIRESR